ncbi:hypothetical protein B0T16DRAFT_326875 [Cercophora newfieldiana]|uniref:Rhodopsin domain-containing protein n=1 Tax=Cercophora newfieldiana TaxID=92897 RepID=A0AA40CUA9_9PEZI|nr:hypothetical protein B0T16DRAFT_326875 [Cercophora newfieldiana]
MSTDGSGAPPPGDGAALGNGTGLAGNGTAAPPPFDPFQFGFPIDPRSAYLSQIYIGLTSSLLLLASITFFIRIYQRIRPVWKMGADDYFIIVGYMLSIVDWGLLLPQQVPTPGFVSMDYALNAYKTGWLSIGVWGVSMTCLKVSIALTLLRIQKKSLAWRIFLYSIIALQVAYGVLNLFFNTVIACRPLSHAWDFTILPQDRQCVSADVMRAASNTGSGVNIVTDVLLSLSPAVFLRKLNRPLRERIFVCVLMGLGLLASVSSIVKTVFVQRFYDPTYPFEDIMPLGASISTYTILEQFTGILAACIPAMKNIFQACLGKMGLSLHDSRSRPGRSGYYLNGRGTNGGTGGDTFQSMGGSNLGTRYARGGKDDTILDDDEEKCLEMPEMRRGVSTPKSARTRSGSGSFREVDFKGSSVVTTVHAV